MHQTNERTILSSTAWAPSFFKASAIVTLSLGVVMHLGSIIVGRETWVSSVMNPDVDFTFGIITAIAALPGLLAWKRYRGGRAGRWVYGLLLALFWVSIPLHGKSLITGNTDYLLAFPIWYSIVEVPMFLVLIYIVTRLRFDQP